MSQQRPYLYLRALRQVDHTVFVVSSGQKVYYEPVFRKSPQPYSSGQQVKRSILDLLSDLLGEGRAPVTFNFEINGGKWKQKEPWSPCDPQFADQLVGGWMRATSEKQDTAKRKAKKEDGEEETEGEKSGLVIKRRSPLSISAMRPLHPLLANINKESLTFDRSDNPERHSIVVRDSDGNEIPADKVYEFLQTYQRTSPMRIWIPEDKVGGRATGLFIYDVAIDLRLLFAVSLNEYERELAPQTRDKLLAAGWQKSTDGTHLICPKARREEIIPALAQSLIQWQIRSNQSRTYSPQNTLAVALSDNANRIGAAIRAELREEESEREKADPVLDPVPGVELFTALPAKGYIRGIIAAPDALEKAEARLIEILEAFPYEESTWKPQ